MHMLHPIRIILPRTIIGSGRLFRIRLEGMRAYQMAHSKISPRVSQAYMLPMRLVYLGNM